ncbi:MAG: carbohydrate kinase [Lachnospiraceae bacterium]|nr:carbohydrate kinase [Lachnospiraceae bacterium]
MKIGGLDIGTTGCKLTVFDEKGKYLDKAYRDYPAMRGSMEQTLDVIALMDGVYGVIKEIAAEYPDLSGIGVTSFGETFVITDEAGTPLFPALLYTDPRGREQRERLEEKLGSFHIAEISGMHPHEMYSLPKIMWYKENKPEIYAKAKHIFLMGDYVVWSLTGNAQIDYSLATRTMGFDIRNLCWSTEIFEAADIDLELFSKTVPTGTPAGNITKEVSGKTGLSEDTVIISVSHDQVAAATGAGVFSSDTAVDGAGTVECLIPIYDKLPDMKHMYDGCFAVVPYVVPGSYICYAFSYTGGALIQWCTDNLAKKEKEIAKGEGLSVNTYLEKLYGDKYGDEPGSLLVLPHFAGAATPYMDTGSKGAIIGLTASTGADEIYRGCMEGVAYEMVLNREALKPSGIHFKHMRATGGGARSEVWMQMKADMLNVSITALETADAGTVGSAMITGVALGIFKDLADAADNMVVRKKTYEPRQEMHEKYMRIYERYVKVYDAVRPLV